MAESFGKCSNFASCGLAYRGKQIPFSGKAICPECGRPLTVTASIGGPKSSTALVISGIAGVVILAGIGVLFVLTRHPKSPPQPVTQSSAPTPLPAPANPPKPTPAPQSPRLTSVPPASTPVTSTPYAVVVAPPTRPPDLVQVKPPPPPTSTPTVSVAPQETPHPLERLIPIGTDDPSVSVEQNIDTNIKREENARVRVEVLKRIDLMPNLSAGDRQKLYTRVDHAHGMGRVITVPFPANGRTVGAREVDQLKGALKDSEVAGLVKNPTVVFVLLGFADNREVEKGNQKISIDRAENISQALKEKCGMQNVTLPIGMGAGAELFDSGAPAKSRVVEVWAVVP